MSYQLCAGGVTRLSDGASIPEDPHNRDWTEYRAWVEAGHESAPAAIEAAPAIISALAFFGRFSDAERVAVQTAINASPQLGVGLVNGLAAGAIDLEGAAVAAWMAGLVAAGAITAPRRTEILAHERA